MDILKTLFHWVLFSSLNAGIVAILIIAFRAVCKNKIAPKLMSLLWLFVIIKLITAPFVAQSQIDVFHLFDHQQISSNLLDTTTNYEPKTALSDSNAPNGNTQLNSNSNVPYQPSLSVSNSQSAHNEVSVMNPDIELVLALIWLVGMLLLTFIFTVSGLSFSRRLKNAERIPDTLLPIFIQNYTQKQSGTIGFYISSNISSPCMKGIITPTIYLPRKIFEHADKQQLTHILMHEIGHVKRRDNVLNVLIVAVTTINWFNPVLWYAMKLYNLDREVSCDAYALEILGQDEKISYGMTLLNYSKMIPIKSFQLNVLSYCKSEKQIRRRIIMIKNFKKSSLKIPAVVAMLCLLFGFSTLTNITGFEFPTDTLQNTAAKDDLIWDALGNSDNMNFNSLEKAMNFTDFSFKVPDYLPPDYELYSVFLSRNNLDNNDLLEICFWSTTDGGKMVSGDEEHHFSLSISKGDFLQNINSQKNTTYDAEKMTINGLDVTSINVHTTEEVKNNFVIFNTTKHLIWKDQNTWYNLEYYTSNSLGPNSTPNVYDNMSQSDLNKILSSMIAPQNIRNVDYTSEFFNNYFSIYDQADLNTAEALLGFSTKFPLHISNDYTIYSARIGNDVYFEEDQKTPLLKTNYSIVSNKDIVQTIEITQGKLSSLYDSIVRNGYLDFYNSNTKTSVFSKTVSINGIDAFLFDIPFKNETKYVWEQNDIYYSATFSGGIEQTERLIKTFIS